MSEDFCARNTTHSLHLDGTVGCKGSGVECSVASKEARSQGVHDPPMKLTVTCAAGYFALCHEA